MISLKQYIFSFILLFVIFTDELFYGFLAYSDIKVAHGMKSYIAIFIAIITYTLLIVDIYKEHLTKTNFFVLTTLLVILFFYILTGVLNNSPQDSYYSYLLVYGSLSIPACYLGIRLTKHLVFDKIRNIIPVFVIPITLILFYREQTFEGLVRNDDSGLNYQTISYFFSYLYSYCIFYLFFSKRNRHFIILDIVMFFMMIINAIGCFLGGGRGAFVFIVFISIFCLFSLFKASHIKKTYLIIITIFTIAIFISFASYFNIWESSGVERVNKSLTTDNNREVLWEKALNAFYDSPLLGHGLGSIWWTVGLYSHNIITDLLAESGIIGTIIVVYVLIEIIRRLFKLYKYHPEYMFVLIVFLGHFVQTMFSGYWYASFKLFFAYGFAFSITLSNSKKNKAI